MGLYIDESATFSGHYHGELGRCACSRYGPLVGGKCAACRQHGAGRLLAPRPRRAPPARRVCRECGEEQPASAFGTGSRVCRTCANTANRERRAGRAPAHYCRECGAPVRSRQKYCTRTECQAARKRANRAAQERRREGR